MDEQVRVTREVGAPAEQVWAMVSDDVSTMGLRVADWGYTLEPTANGCRVTETWTERRHGLFKPIARLVTGVADRESHNRAGMEQTLERLAAVAESGAPAR